jgi:RHS repeat-associated protein
VKTGGTFARTGLPQPVTGATYNSLNQQLTFGGQTFSYDLNGNLTSDGVNTYTWNARNWLVSITGPGVNAIFQYDGVGRRINKGLNGLTVRHLFDGLEVIQEKIGETVSANLLKGAFDELVTRSDSEGTSNFLLDSIDSTLARTNASGSAVAEYTYEPFGKATVTGAPGNNVSEFTGRDNDGTGLNFYRARYYSPLTQRFISEDPIEFEGGDFNLYAYVGNSPTMGGDPMGLATQAHFSGGVIRPGPPPAGKRTAAGEDSLGPCRSRLWLMVQALRMYY